MKTSAILTCASYVGAGLDAPSTIQAERRLWGDHIAALKFVRSAFPGFDKNAGIAIDQRLGHQYKSVLVPLNDLGNYVADLDLRLPTFISTQTYRPGCWKKLGTNVFRLSTLALDFDFYKMPEVAHFEAQAIAAAIVDKCFRRGLPAPSTVVGSGRGVQAYWRHNAVSTNAEPRWRAIHRELLKVFGSLGADRAAVAPTQVLRLPGSINEKSGIEVMVISNSGCQYRFDDLADAILPLGREAYREHIASLAVERAKRRACGTEKSRPSNKLNFASWNQTLLDDIERLIHLRGPFLPPGERDEIMFCRTVTLCAMMPIDAARSEALRACHVHCGWDSREALSRLSAVLRRAREGKPYRLKKTTIIERLGITEAEMEAAGLKVLVTVKIQSRNSGRRRREALGQQTRAEYLDKVRSAKPWLRLGVSRRTFYAWKAKGIVDAQGEVQKEHQELPTRLKDLASIELEAKSGHKGGTPHHFTAPSQCSF